MTYHDLLSHHTTPHHSIPYHPHHTFLHHTAPHHTTPLDTLTTTPHLSPPHYTTPHHTTGRLSDVLIAQYPALRETIRSAASRVLSEAVEGTTHKMRELLAREKDPFTMNDFLQQWVNKLKFDR